MKEATGELSTTVITVVAIAAVAAIFTVFVLPAIRNTIRAKTYCSSAVGCSECNGGKMECSYYEEDDSGQLVLNENNKIKCDCEAAKNK